MVAFGACVWGLRLVLAFLQRVSDYLKCDKIGLAFDANVERTRLYGLRGHAHGGDIDGLLHKKNGKYAFHNAYLPHRTYIEMKKLS